MKKRKVSIRKINIIIALSIAIIFFSVGIFSLAKYVGNSIWEYYLNSQKFYFTSEELDGTTNLNNDWTGGAVSFEISNYNENNEVSDHEITYNVKCHIIEDETGNLTCNLNNTGTNEYSGVLQQIEVCNNETSDGVDTSSLDEETCNNRGYTWVNGNTSLNHFFEIVSSDPNAEVENVKVRIEAQATDPYTKTLTGEFHLFKGESSIEDIVFIHESYSDYEKVIISNFTYRDREFFLRWNSDDLRIVKSDYSNASIGFNGFINEIEFKVNKDNTVTYTFYKTDPNQEITINDFILVEKPIEEGIRVTSIELYESSAGTTELSNPTYTDTTTNIHLDLLDSNSTFTYKVTIANTTPDYYHLKNIVDITNTANISYVTNGLSLYHEFAPGTESTFYLTFDGDKNISYDELILNTEYIFEFGELYKDDTLNGAVPEIIDGLIPIVYDDNIDQWTKADVVNGQWYNYSELRWANATSVVSTKKDYYAEAEVGTIVEMKDMTSMMVWVPRYSYTLKEDYGYHGYGGSTVSLSTPGAYDIKFGGTSMLDTGSGVYTGDYPRNYYTSSAFCWGNTCDDPATRNDPENTEIPGFWVAKFEASKTDNILYSKPNTTPMIRYSISATFNYVQDLMNGTNGYDNYGFVGYVDAHLIKNTEWGAIAYLSQSKYGKYGNTDYTGANKEIYINNCSTYVTGVGGDNPHAASTTSSCTTNTYDTYNGMGASTTGNIYGVYDMVGGTFDRVMGVMLGPQGQFIPDYSGFTSLPEGRYINVYPYGTYTIGDVSPIKGDALTDTIMFYDDRYLNDPRFTSTNYYLYHWVYRGGSLFFTNTDANGIFSYTLFNGIADSHHSSRFTITMYGSIVEDLSNP